MNKVQQINLGGVPFTIDEDALEHLTRYLNTIHAHFRQSDGYEEITQDIEARLAELFREGMGQRQIVILKDVKDAIVIMGTPEDFGAEPMDEPVGSEEPKRKRAHESDYRTGRRLFRNPEDEVIGGVCSGIAAYFGINDPLWIRLLFIVVTISGGFGVPAYIILWAILPKAESASDRLAMRGEPINVSNIGRIIEEEIEHISYKVSEIGGKKKGATGGGALGETLRQIVAFIGQVFAVLIKLISNIWKPLLILCGALVALSLLASWIAMFTGGVFFWPYVDYFAPEWPMVTMLGAFNILMIIGVVLLSAGLSIIRLLYGTRMSRPWQVALSAFWILNIISFFGALTFMARDFSNEAHIDRRVELSGITTDTLNFRIDEAVPANDEFNIDGELFFYHDAMISDNVDVEIRKGDGEGFVLEERLESRGTNLAMAEELAAGINYQEEATADALTVPTYFRIPKGTKWRVQGVRAIVEIPVGKFIRFDGETRFYIDDADKVNYRPRIYDNPGSTWQMTEAGLQCLDCTEE
ncbi:MAG: PspC domain-containing protein [Phaeodactylibacter sp.]|uniref:PspC domain-containing protein n=1 Tax=Phaeodactylibacter sp. TaxID=1940289 RepID=UPI0032EBEC0B